MLYDVHRLKTLMQNDAVVKFIAIFILARSSRHRLITLGGGVLSL